MPGSTGLLYRPGQPVAASRRKVVSRSLMVVRMLGILPVTPKRGSHLSSFSLERRFAI